MKKLIVIFQLLMLVLVVPAQAQNQKKDFRNDFEAFKKTKDYAKLQDEKAVSESPKLQQMYDFEHSEEYKTYLDYAESELPKEYKALEKEVSTEEFKKEFAFWSNPNRWKTTDEYQQEVRYKQLAERADINFYLEQDPAEIARLEKELK